MSYRDKIEISLEIDESIKDEVIESRLARMDEEFVENRTDISPKSMILIPAVFAIFVTMGTYVGLIKERINGPDYAIFSLLLGATIFVIAFFTLLLFKHFAVKNHNKEKTRFAEMAENGFEAIFTTDGYLVVTGVALDDPRWTKKFKLNNIVEIDKDEHFTYLRMKSGSTNYDVELIDYYKPRLYDELVKRCGIR